MHYSNVLTRKYAYPEVANAIPTNLAGELVTEMRLRKRFVDLGFDESIKAVVELRIIRVFAQLGKVAANAFLGFHH
jgi:hypothetical protein